MRIRTLKIRNQVKPWPKNLLELRAYSKSLAEASDRERERREEIITPEIIPSIVGLFLPFPLALYRSSRRGHPVFPIILERERREEIILERLGIEWLSKKLVEPLVKRIIELHVRRWNGVVKGYMRKNPFQVLILVKGISFVRKWKGQASTWEGNCWQWMKPNNRYLFKK